MADWGDEVPMFPNTLSVQAWRATGHTAEPSRADNDSRFTVPQLVVDAAQLCLKREWRGAHDEPGTMRALIELVRRGPDAIRAELAADALEDFGNG